MKKTIVALLLAFFIANISNGQNPTQQKNDSLLKAWQSRFDSIATNKRIAFLRSFDSIPIDTGGNFNMSGMQLQKLPEISKFNNITYLNASNNKLKKLLQDPFK